MKCLPLAAALSCLAVLGGCVAPVGPVQVTRFHLPDTSMLGRGTITVEPASGQDGNSLEFRSYAAAVERQLILAGYAVPAAGAGRGAQLALLRIERRRYRPERTRGPVSVGLGGSTGSYGSGVGLGVGIDLSGPPPEQVDTQLAATIRERTTDRTLWEGKADFTVRASSPMASTQLGAARLAEALFKGFPGQSGETIEVR